MDYSHLKENLNFIVEYVRNLTGKDISEGDKEFFASALNLSYGDGYRRAIEVGEETKLKDKFKLTFEQFDLFIKVHGAHMNAMGTENKQKYALSNIKKIVWDSREDCLKVYYPDEWWHYDKRGCWY